jgi:cell division septum initiation protein DivIVA
MTEPRKPANPQKAQRWPTKALWASESAMVAMVGIGDKCAQIDKAGQGVDTTLAQAAKQAQRVDRLAREIADAVRNDNRILAIQLANELRTVNADARANEQDMRSYVQDIRRFSQDVRRLASDAGEVLMLARRGEYRE